MNYRAHLKSSAESLSKLRDTLSSQRAAMKIMKCQSETLSDTVEALKNQVESVSAERDMRVQKYEDKVQHLHSQLCNAVAEKSYIQIALDEAKRELQATKNEVRIGRDSFGIVQDERTLLLANVEDLRVELQRLTQDKERIVQTCDDLQHSLMRTKEENNDLKQDLNTKAAEIRDLESRLVQLNNKNMVCEEMLHHLNQSRKQEMEENNLIQRSNRSLSMLLEDKIKEIASLGEDSRRDKAMVECLRRELQDSQTIQEKIIGEKQNLDKCFIDLEQRLQFAQEETRNTGKLVESLNKKCHHLEKRYDDTRSDKLYLEGQTAKLTRMVKELEDGLKTCTQAKYLADAKIHELEARIDNGESENRQLRDLYLQSEQERTGLMESQKQLTDELKRTREELMTKKKELLGLEQRQEDVEEDSVPALDLAKMRALVRRMQASTNERVLSMSRDATTLIHVLQDKKDNLELILRKTEKERDACISCLEYGRKKLARVTRTVNDEVFDARIIESQSTQDLGTAEIFLSTHPPQSSELFLTTFSMDPLEFASRAEEIATCLAVSAKASLGDCQDENLNLRSKIYRLEEERKAAIAALQSRIRLTEEGDK